MLTRPDAAATRYEEGPTVESDIPECPKCGREINDEPCCLSGRELDEWDRWESPADITVRSEGR